MRNHVSFCSEIGILNRAPRIERLVTETTTAIRIMIFRFRGELSSVSPALD
jgi:hypothetical protein